MPLKWKLFRLICIVQMLAAATLGIMSMIAVFATGNFFTFMVVLMFVSIFLQAILAIGIINNNYPDIPIAGKQKTNFNRLYLLNFLLLVFLFGVIFAELRDLRDIATLLRKSIIELPLKLFLFLLSNIGVLILQLIIFYGLYQLRSELYFNFRKKDFDFEKTQVP